MTLKSWESADKKVKTEVIEFGEHSKKPTECASCEIIIENVEVINASIEDLKEKFHSKILDGTKEKLIIIGEATCEIDLQIERAIEMMNVLDRRLVTLNLSKGLDQALIIKFLVTLIKLQPHDPIWEWTPETKYNVALKYKEIGVELFKQSRWVDAFHKFSRACKILITLEPIPDLELEKSLENNINSLRLVLYNNMAACQLNCKNYEHTITLCSKIINKEEKNVKALFRRGVAYGSLKDYENAVSDLKSAVTLEPNNRSAKEQFQIYNVKLQEANQKCEEMIRRMFKV